MNKLKYCTLSAVLLLSIGLSACSHKVSTPGDVLSEVDMADFLQQAYLLEGFYAIETGYQYDTLHPEMLASYDSLLASFDITRDDFERSVAWYSKHPDIYERVHDSVLARIDRERAAIDEAD